MTQIIKDALLKQGNAKKFILISDSIWDKPLPTYVIENVIKQNMAELGVGNCYFASFSGSTSYDFINGKNSASKDTLRDVINECLGNDGEDTIIQWSLGINDVIYANKVYNYDVDFALPEKKIIAAIEFLLAYKPKVKIYFVSAPAAGVQSFNDNYEIMYKKIAAHFNAPLVSGYDALKGVRRTNQDSSFYMTGDGLHPNELGLLRFWNFILMNIVPDSYLKALTVYQYPTPVPSPNNQAAATIINNGWRNDFWTVSGVLELKPTNETFHRCFVKYNVLEGQLMSVKFPIGLMGTFVPEVKWVTKDGKLVTGNPTKLHSTYTGQDTWIIQAPYNVDRLHVNISDDDAAFDAAYALDNTICHLKPAYAKTSYAAPIEDIMVGFPKLLNY